MREREAASRDALSAANSRIEVLSSQVALLAGREEAANAEAEAFASQVWGKRYWGGRDKRGEPRTGREVRGRERGEPVS